MSHHRLLSQDSSDEKSSEQEIDHGLNNHSTHIGRFPLHPHTEITILLVILMLNLFILPVSILQLGSRSCVPKPDAGGTVVATFEQDRAFQSLDHLYDNAWASLSLNKSSAGLIKVPGDGINEDSEGKGTISM